MLIIPAIDLLDGNCVRLEQGNRNKCTVYSNDPLAVIKDFKAAGATLVHIVDLNGAFDGTMSNFSVVKLLAQEIEVQVGGGIRTKERIETLTELGVTRIIVGTNLTELKKYGVIGALDFKNGQLAIKGWVETKQINLRELLNGVDEVIVTDITTDGMLNGPSIELLKKIQRYGVKVIASGGICSLEDLKKLKELDVNGVIIGKALYEKKFTLKEAIEYAQALEMPSGLTKRIIPCLDIACGRVVKGTNFTNLTDVGDAIELARRYYQEGADELCFLDITATLEGRTPIYELVKRVAREICIPFSVGGGIRTLEDARTILSCGAEKVVLGTAAVQNPKLVKEIVKEFGSQAVVISIDAKRVGDSWNQFIKGGREDSLIDVVTFAKEMEQLGAGEILLNSIDKDGTKEGFDIELCNTVCKAVNIPVIASSGAKDAQSFVEVFRKTDVSGALAARIFHTKETEIKKVKKTLKESGVDVREV